MEISCFDKRLETAFLEDEKSTTLRTRSLADHSAEAIR